VKDVNSRMYPKVSTGVFIPVELLTRAHITDDNIEIEVTNKEIRIHPKTVREKIFTFDSSLWNCVGFVEKEDISGKDHDKYIYDER